ncbi:hypothetical protein ASE90_09785 [Sphingomonas sp. Leaf67]|uniref:hypothetical protein n=1 Tax=unclassified Sphingomonas TaxID=196159 RepID=UPI0006F53E47|nr:MULTISPECIES: hypothetical protein [unclassified Sphingomonas]KQM89871.1 hypothetical protein ASE70_16250 [Sphingomonas sp. Leaf22]KQN83029.1 hypothetical protein ASE90_09785 [Sphingomonas sp. Leaf67]
MSEIVFFVLFWASYAAWLALFIWLAWTGKVRLLLLLGAVMLLGFVITCATMQTEIAEPNRNHSGDMGYGLIALFAAAVLLVPLGLAAITYPVGRLWSR